ncbi:MAG: LysR family transcriptional regulator [Sphingomonadales bacterium]|nr:LysR family transcriptional regulator [Sphingomonadales bacterium]PIX64677.1 MAG: LysR family transcriptional regulator [Sphingomonadales bacterium CG_4_10_14_3_um_filter_58_15]NCO48443.1 LysR family transcriptional regulator [Sphingomonadales bacterium]NCO99259.1 LysR family transcriptional regulator [Sphingomonadales bacterium]NCP27707.1 LysR family transcriptional regulator [Sphingomonadales bacterium]
MSLPDYEAWAIFASVARLGSFTAAANELALSKPTISKAISRLEQALGTVLFHRTSRKISLSTAGKSLLPHAQQIARDGEAAMEAARDTTHLLKGQVRVAAPLSYGVSHLAPVIADFMCAYPEIAVDLQLNDAQVDLIEQGFDCAIRIADLPDSSLRAIQLRKVQGYFIAAPSYIKRIGQPEQPSDLVDHDCFIYSNTQSPEFWQITGPDNQIANVRPKCRFQSNNGDVMLPALIAGRGIGYLPDFLCQNALDAGELINVLPGWRMGDIALNIVTPPSRLRPARVDALVNFLRDNLL